MGRPPIGKVAMTAAERVRRYRLKHHVTKRNEKLLVDATIKARIAEMAAEIARLRAAAKAATKADAAPVSNEDTIGLRFLRRAKPKTTKTVKAPLPPDEERDRKIKSLQTRVRNLTAELYAAREWTKHGAASGMNFATMSAIAKCLHPDSKPSDADREAAFKLFTQWKKDRKT